MAQLYLQTFGGCQVQLDSRPVKFPTRKALALLVYLAVEGAPKSREQLAALFWPESEAAQGRAVLRNTLGYLKQALQPAPFLVARPDSVALRSAPPEAAINLD